MSKLQLPSEHDPAGSAPSVEPAAPSESRRRLIRGAAAALPTVATLASGAATAAASNLGCFDASVPASVPRFTNPDDSYLRKAVYQGKLGDAKAYCVMDNQAQCLNAMDPTKAADGSVWLVGTNRVTASNGNISGIKSGTAYALVYVDRGGTIATLDPNSPDLHAVQHSCWTSILGGRISTLG